MDLLLNQPLSYDALAAFLAENYAPYAFFLLYEGHNDWDDVPPQSRILQYTVQEAQRGAFRYGLSVFMPTDDLRPFLENLSATLARYFACGVVCDASRVVLTPHHLYYALLFEQDTVYLVDDRFYEEDGTLTKVIALNYACPPLPPL